MSRYGGIRELVYDLLVRDRVARTDDIYLYCQVIRRLNPELLEQPFECVLLEHFDNGLVHFESVRRVRAKIQEEHPELVDLNTYKKRKKSQEFYIKTLLGA